MVPDVQMSLKWYTGKALEAQCFYFEIINNSSLPLSQFVMWDSILQTDVLRECWHNLFSFVLLSVVTCPTRTNLTMILAKLFRIIFYVIC